MSSRQECEVCGESEFEVVDGLYFCSNCQTQSQYLREEERDVFDSGVPSGRLRIRQPTKTVKDSSKQEEKKSNELGRPWRTCEGFTIIVREQVHALLQMGADPRLQEIVLRMWMLYLSKIGVAFPHLVPEHKKVRHRYVAERDEQLLTVQEPRVTPNRRFEKTRQSRGGTLHAREARLWQERKELEELFKNEEFYQDDNPFADMLPDAVHQNKAVASEYRSYKTLHSGWGVYDVNYLSVDRCTAFSYIGLLYTHNMTTPADYVRWLFSGKIPYENVSARFPADMKFYNSDRQTFSRERKMQTNRLRSTVDRLLTFLKLSGLRHPPLQAMCSRFLLQLNLPGELHGLVAAFIRRTQLQLRTYQKVSRGSALVEIDVVAMATIIVLLKVLFGLDGKKELLLSEFARNVNKSQQLDKKKLFEFDCWLRYNRTKFKNNANTFLDDPLNMGGVRDVEQVLNEYRDTYGHSKAYSHHDRFAHTQHQMRADIGGSLCKVFDATADDSDDDDALCSDTDSDSDDPLQIYPSDDDEGPVEDPAVSPDTHNVTTPECEHSTIVTSQNTDVRLEDDILTSQDSDQRLEHSAMMSQKNKRKSVSTDAPPLKRTKVLTKESPQVIGSCIAISGNDSTEPKNRTKSSSQKKINDSRNDSHLRQIETLVDIRKAKEAVHAADRQSSVKQNREKNGKRVCTSEHSSLSAMKEHEEDFSADTVAYILGQDPSQYTCKPPPEKNGKHKGQNQKPVYAPDIFQPSYWLIRTNKDKKPISYQSVLALCSHVILTSEERVHACVEQLEYVYLVGAENTNKFTIKKSVLSFIFKYFQDTKMQV